MTGCSLKECRYDMLDYAASLLKSAGFELQYVSKQSEASYYALPGREHYWLRLAGHRKTKRGLRGKKDVVVAKATFNCPHLTPYGAESMLAQAIGQYMIKSGGHEERTAHESLDTAQ